MSVHNDFMSYTVLTLSGNVYYITYYYYIKTQFFGIFMLLLKTNILNAHDELRHVKNPQKLLFMTFLPLHYIKLYGDTVDPSDLYVRYLVAPVLQRFITLDLALGSITGLRATHLSCLYTLLGNPQGV